MVYYYATQKINKLLSQGINELHEIPEYTRNKSVIMTSSSLTCDHIYHHTAAHALTFCRKTNPIYPETYINNTPDFS